MRHPVDPGHHQLARTHDFVRTRRDAFTTIDVAGAPLTAAAGINSRGQIVGFSYPLG